MTGYIKLHRVLLNSQVFINEGLLKVWIYCLIRANHKPCWVPINTGKGTTEIYVGPGQFIYGRKEAAKDLRMKPSSVRNRMTKLKNIGNVDILTDTHYSIVTICNWDTYQGKDLEEKQETGQAKDKLRTTKGQAKDTDKNDKNVKNDKNIHPLCSDLHNVSGMDEPLTVEQGDKLISEFGESVVSETLLQMENYKPLRKKSKSANLTVRNWIKRNMKDQRKSEMKVYA